MSEPGWAIADIPHRPTRSLADGEQRKLLQLLAPYGDLGFQFSLVPRVEVEAGKQLADDGLYMRLAPEAGLAFSKLHDRSDVM
jgi:hypothetical protein